MLRLQSRFHHVKGVVANEATAPAKPPHANNDPTPSLSPSGFILALRASLAATDTHPYGMFIASVVGNERYKPANPPCFSEQALLPRGLGGVLVAPLLEDVGGRH